MLMQAKIQEINQRSKQRIRKMKKSLKPTSNLAIKRTTYFVAMIFIASCSGCYPDWPEHAGTAVIRGNITLDGLPLGKANVAFVPLSLHANYSEVMPIAYGQTDAGGDFDLAYGDETKEVMAGRYTVIISKVEPSEETDLETAPPGLIPDSLQKFKEFQSDGEQVPSAYNRDSSLVYEIVASPGIVSPKFELTTVDETLDELPVIDLPIK